MLNTVRISNLGNERTELSKTVFGKNNAILVLKICTVKFCGGVEPKFHTL
jgi:hypothetical protein